MAKRITHDTRINIIEAMKLPVGTKLKTNTIKEILVIGSLNGIKVLNIEGGSRVLYLTENVVNSKYRIIEKIK